MRIIGSIDDVFLRARDNADVGNLVVRVYKQYCRKPKVKELPTHIIVGKRNGPLPFRVHRIDPKEVYEAACDSPK